MELIAAILLAGPLGYFAPTRRQALVRYLVAWAVIFPIQTVVVWTDTDPSGNDWLYFVFNAVILALGIGLNRLGHGLRRRRATALGSAA
jgi:hypothetical protein